MPAPFPAFSVAATATTSPARPCTTASPLCPSRRQVLLVVPALLLPSITATAATARSAPAASSAAAAYIRLHCAPFLARLSPLSSSALLFRGTRTTSPNAFSLVSPDPDLLAPATYGPAGAAFFSALANSSPVSPTNAHIGTGDLAEAARWGPPVTVWPVGECRYAFREKGRLVYEEGDTVAQAEQTRGTLVSADVRDALQQGKELMFDCTSFVEVGDALLPEVLRELGMHA